MLNKNIWIALALLTAAMMAGCGGDGGGKNVEVPTFQCEPSTEASEGYPNSSGYMITSQAEQDCCCKNNTPTNCPAPAPTTVLDQPIKVGACVERLEINSVEPLQGAISGATSGAGTALMVASSYVGDGPASEVASEPIDPTDDKSTKTPSSPVRLANAVSENAVAGPTASKKDSDILGELSKSLDSLTNAPASDAGSNGGSSGGRKSGGSGSEPSSNAAVASLSAPPPTKNPSAAAPSGKSILDAMNTGVEDSYGRGTQTNASSFGGSGAAKVEVDAGADGSSTDLRFGAASGGETSRAPMSVISSSFLISIPAQDDVFRIVERQYRETNTQWIIEDSRKK